MDEEMTNQIRKSGAVCDICLREQKRVPATHIFPVKISRYYFVCDKHYSFLRFTGGVTEEQYYQLKEE
jgi:hypothetical protein